MPTSKTTPDFLDGVNKLLSKDTKPKLPALNDPRWAEYFDNTFEERRETLAQAWFRCADIQISKGRSQPITNAGLVFEENSAWLVKLRPYIRSGHVWQGNFHLPSLNFAHIFADVPCTDEPSQFIRGLWFGTDDEKLDALLRITTARNKTELLMYGKTVLPQLAWKATELPNAKREHKIAACQVSYWAGYIFGDVKAEPSEEAWAWHILGTYSKGGNQFDPKLKEKESSRSHYETIKDFPKRVHDILSQSYPEAMAALFPVIFGFAKKVPGGHRISDASLLGNVCQNPASFHEALATWIPLHAGVIHMAELSGMSMDETLALVQDLGSHKHVATQALPNDFNADLGM